MLHYIKKKKKQKKDTILKLEVTDTWKSIENRNHYQHTTFTLHTVIYFHSSNIEEPFKSQGKNTLHNSEVLHKFNWTV